MPWCLPVMSSPQSILLQRGSLSNKDSRESGSPEELSFKDRLCQASSRNQIPFHHWFDWSAQEKRKNRLEMSKRIQRQIQTVWTRNTQTHLKHECGFISSLLYSNAVDKLNLGYKGKNKKAQPRSFVAQLETLTFKLGEAIWAVSVVEGYQGVEVILTRRCCFTSSATFAACPPKFREFETLRDSSSVINTKIPINNKVPKKCDRKKEPKNNEVKMKMLVNGR